MNQLRPLSSHPKIYCPDCALMMMPYQCSSVVVDRCKNCHGIWFDKSELGKFRDSLKTMPLEKIDVHLLDPKDVIQLSSCPHCESMLIEMSYSYKTNVTLKKCHKCDGCWLPHVELMKFIDLAKIAKVDEPDVRGVVKEWIAFENEKKRSKDFQAVAGHLNRTVRFPYGRIPSIIVPLYDDNPTSRLAWVTKVLIAMNVIIFYLFMNHPAFVPDQYLSIFMHKNIYLLLVNSYFLWTFGDNVEDIMGPVKMILFYALCGLASGSASGAISGLLGAYLFLFPKINIKTWINGQILNISVWIYVFFWILFSLHGKYTLIANLAGLIAGFVIAKFLHKNEIIQKPANIM